MTPDLTFLHELRRAELAVWVERARLDRNAKVLEIGAGTGFQASILAQRFEHVAAVDVAGSTYADAQMFPVKTYDGEHLPFSDAAFDVVYTSHVLEHVSSPAALDSEIRRVLKPGGRAIHIVPTHSWRIWSCLAHYPALPGLLLSRLQPRAVGTGTSSRGTTLVRRLASLLFAPTHGERGNRLTEFLYFRPRIWGAGFTEAGWRVADSFPVGIFYTGYMLFGGRLAVRRRRAWAQALGSSSHCFMLERSS